MYSKNPDLNLKIPFCKWKVTFVNENFIWDVALIGFFKQKNPVYEGKDEIEKMLQINEYRLKHNIEHIQDNSLWFVDSASILIFLIYLFAIVMGCGMVANEFSGGTIKLLLVRPSKRFKILVSK